MFIIRILISVIISKVCIRQPLDDFCKVIRKEIQVIVAHAMVSPDTWVMSSKNRPFSPLSNLAASELILKAPEELRAILRGGISTRNDCFDENLDSDFFHIRLGNLQFMNHPHLSRLTSKMGKF